MTLAVLFDCSSDTLAQYDRAFDLAPELAHQSARPIHLCASSGDGFLIVDVWESAEAFATFGAVLGPVLDQVDLHPSPDVRTVHRLITHAAPST